MPSDWNSVPDPGGPMNNRDEPGYSVRKGYVDWGTSVLAVGDQFLNGSTTLTVQSINRQYLGPDGITNNDTVTFVGGATVTLAALVGGSWLNGSFVPSYKRTYSATQLSVRGPQW